MLDQSSKASLPFGAWDKLDLHSDGDSLSLLYTIEELISQRRFSLESVDLVLEGKSHLIEPHYNKCA